MNSLLLPASFCSILVMIILHGKEEQCFSNTAPRKAFSRTRSRSKSQLALPNTIRYRGEGCDSSTGQSDILDLMEPADTCESAGACREDSYTSFFTHRLGYLSSSLHLLHKIDRRLREQFWPFQIPDMSRFRDELKFSMRERSS